MKTRHLSTCLLTGLMLSLCSLLAWSPAFEGLFTPAGEFQDIECNQILADSTIGQSNSYSNSDYASCVLNGSQYNAGDRLFRLELADSTAAEIVLNDIDGADLVLVLLSNTIDQETMADCPDTCMALTSSGSIEMTLPPGTFWIVVDGAQEGEVLDEGHFELSIICPKSYTEISCGQVVQDSTIGRVSNFDILDFAGCFESVVNTYNAGDQLYKFEINETKTIDIVLEKLDNQGLHLFLLSSAIDINDGSVCPGFCIGKSDTGAVVERITATLPLGVYWLVVDGNVLPSTPVNLVDEGNFKLSIECPKDFSVIECGNLVMGSTEGRLDNYNAADYGSCASGDYFQGDVTYMWDLMSEQMITINLTPTDGDDLDIVLMSGVFDEVSQLYCPDTCISIGSAGVGPESIQMTLVEGTYFIMVDGVMDEGNFMLEVMCAPLPIQLVRFDGGITAEGIEIHWETASELFFEGFYLQRGQTGNDWTNLDWIEAQGGPTQSATYFYHDEAPFPGANYYRLKSVDLDGTFEWSNIIRIDAQKAEKIVLYPSPAHDYIMIDGVPSGTSSEYFIRSPQGQLLSKGTMSSTNNRLDISQFASGALFLTIKYDDRLKTYSIRKM